MTAPITATLADLVARIADGVKLIVPADYSGVAMQATLEMVRQQRRNLHLVCLPTTGLQGDVLIGAGCVDVIETSAVTLGEFGSAPRFSEAVRTGTIRLRDATCPAIHAAVQAAEKGVPFATLRGLIGSDLVRHRPDWRIIDNPFQPGDRIIALPAIQPDVALFHAPRADRNGNVWIGRRRELLTMAHAARLTLVTVEEIVDADFYDDERMAAGVVPALYVGGVAIARRGAAPVGLWEGYGPDAPMLARYAEQARSAAGFAALLADWMKTHSEEAAQ